MGIISSSQISYKSKNVLKNKVFKNLGRERGIEMMQRSWSWNDYSFNRNKEGNTDTDFGQVVFEVWLYIQEWKLFTTELEKGIGSSGERLVLAIKTVKS